LNRFNGNTGAVFHCAYATFIGSCSVSSVSCFLISIYLGKNISTTVITARILYSLFCGTLFLVGGEKGLHQKKFPRCQAFAWWTSGSAALKKYSNIPDGAFKKLVPMYRKSVLLFKASK